jgi:UDP-N-acetylglucosamine 2-epimerase
LTHRKVALAIGTRPEAIKMAPVLRALEASSRLQPILISTGQHRELLETAFSPFGLVPDHHLDVMEENQTTNQIIVRVIERLSKLLAEIAPDALLVQGDTTSVLSSALASYSARVLVGHVEAGLRTYDHENPFPEEANRQLVDRISRCSATSSTPPRRRGPCGLCTRIRTWRGLSRSSLRTASGSRSSRRWTICTSPGRSAPAAWC